MTPFAESGLEFNAFDALLFLGVNIGKSSAFLLASL